MLPTKFWLGFIMVGPLGVVACKSMRGDAGLKNTEGVGARPATTSQASALRREFAAASRPPAIGMIPKDGLSKVFKCAFYDAAKNSTAFEEETFYFQHGDKGQVLALSGLDDTSRVVAVFDVTETEWKGRGELPLVIRGGSDGRLLFETVQASKLTWVYEAAISDKRLLATWYGLCSN